MTSQWWRQSKWWRCVSQLEPGIQDYRLSWVMSKYKPTLMSEQHEGWLIWTYYVFPIIKWPGFVIITPSFSPFGAVFSNQRFSNCSSAMDVGFVKLSSDCFCGTVFKMNVKFCSHLCCSTSMIYRHNPFNVRWSLSLNFGFWSLFLLADDVLPWCVCMSP